MALTHAIGCLDAGHSATDAVGLDDGLVHLPWVRATRLLDPDLEMGQSDYGSYHLRRWRSSRAPARDPALGLVLDHDV